MAEQYHRFVALGDSQTEGLNDGDEINGFGGWADRFATELARTTSPDLEYANLALRGCRAQHVLDVQLPAALALQPDLAAVCVGMNDLLRHDYDLDAVVDAVEQTFIALRATGCRVLTTSFPDVALMLPVMGWLRPREELLNARLVEAAGRHGVDVLDLFSLDLSADPAMWSHDRIHGSPVGHERIAAGMAELMGLPGSNHGWAVGEAPSRSPLRVVAREATWLATFLVPFLYRQLRGKGPGTTAAAKRPELVRVLAADDRVSSD
ncbi:SGNH/GDSL hydrolase family protein [Nocardioides marmorisolisilvae]|uniref:SGNH/GDSL hydrolase family protein n=1 Tax=Nocardioides marmorisolisilvae TaxID=1542737 RepID=A0A3N0DQ12_9ACTN|nr:SGNH/GDSL hydrolase family protein [Nocardioides marmorisolisilvae]RNL77732.1 SGNH/GDSL hydrolase family protein [Nocardioides marmorisolisilvae]